jgi:hypothetical protein
MLFTTISKIISLLFFNLPGMLGVSLIFRILKSKLVRVLFLICWLNSRL